MRRQTREPHCPATDPCSTSRWLYVAGCMILEKSCGCSKPVLSSVKQGNSIPLAGLDVLTHVESLAQGRILSTCSERMSHCDHYEKKNFFNLKKKKKSSPVPGSALGLPGRPLSAHLSGRGWSWTKALHHLGRLNRARGRGRWGS